MSGRPALSSDAALPRLLVHFAGSDEGFDVFEVIAASGDILQVRSAFLFEVGEELHVRVERGAPSPVIQDRAASPLERGAPIARVRAHLGPPDARITEIELLAADLPAGTRR